MKKKKGNKKITIGQRYYPGRPIETIDTSELIEAIRNLMTALEFNIFLFGQSTGLSLYSLNNLQKEHPENEEFKRLVQCLNRLKRIKRDYPEIFEKRGNNKDEND